jgi:hypothetical protein
MYPYTPVPFMALDRLFIWVSAGGYHFRSTVAVEAETRAARGMTDDLDDHMVLRKV